MKTIESKNTIRRDRLMHEHLHDPYKMTSKIPEPAVCPVCSAVYHKGRWRWADSWPANAQRHTCSACHRIRDNYPAGILTISGGAAHHEEMVRLARHIEEQESAEHPLRRIIQLEPNAHGVTITTTDVHLPHQIGEAVQHAFKGELETHYDQEGYFARVSVRCPA